MELVAVFAIGWVLSHAFSEKRDEYSASQEAHRERYMKKLNDRHPSWGRARRERYLQNAARRNSLGHFAYLLRHGWSSTFNDFAHGWKNAKSAHEEWKAGRATGAKKPGPLATFKAGWKKRWARRPKASGYYMPRPDLTPEPERGSTDTPAPNQETGASAPKPDARAEPMRPGKIIVSGFGADDTTPKPPGGQGDGAKVVPINGNTTKSPQAQPVAALGNNGGNMSGEIGGYAGAHNLADRYQRTLASAGSELETYQAELMASAKLGNDQQVMQTLAAAQEALANAATAFAAHKRALSGHQEGHEYAASKGAAAADTQWLGQG